MGVAYIPRMSIIFLSIFRAAVFLKIHRGLDLD